MSALPELFGHEPQTSDPWPRLLDVVARFGAMTAELRDFALFDAEGVGSAGKEVLHPGGMLSSLPAMDPQDLDAPMRVVLMGRTMAGKSSLLTAMTGSHFDRIGDGRQRFSRDIFGAATSASAHIEVVDTPGVGAHGGADDTEVALKAALDADVIVWVNSSDSIQEESATALKLLGVIGKPIVVALNCRQSLEGVGRLNLVRFPERVFQNKDGLLEEIRRHMADAGVEPLEVVYVHALAAAEAQATAEIDGELYSASRIDELTNALLREHAAHSESRRVIRFVDTWRQQAEELSASLRRGSDTLRGHAARDREMTNDVHTRINRAMRVAGEAMASDVESAVGRRRDWHLTVTDFGKSVQSDWTDDIAGMHEEVARALESRQMNLTAELQSAIEDADAEWTTVSHEQFPLRDLAGFSEVWGNRIAKAGVGVAGSALGFSGGAWLGAQIGGALGLSTGPGAIVTAGVGFVVGGIGALAAGQIKTLADHIFLGKDGVLRKRREEVAKQVGPILDEVTQAYQKAIAAQLDEVGAGLSSERKRADQDAASLDRLSSQWRHHNDHVRALVSELDRETTSALLRIHRRERLARSVRRATRVPGVCILTEFEEVAFWEAWLFPPDLGETLAGGKLPTSGAVAASALSYALGLVDAPVRLVRANDASALLSIDAKIPPAITDTWSNALAAHVGKGIQIETTRRTTSQ